MLFKSSLESLVNVSRNQIDSKTLFIVEPVSLLWVLCICHFPRFTEISGSAILHFCDYTSAIWHFQKSTYGLIQSTNSWNYNMICPWRWHKLPTHCCEYWYTKSLEGATLVAFRIDHFRHKFLCVEGGLCTSQFFEIVCQRNNTIVIHEIQLFF